MQDYFVFALVCIAASAVVGVIAGALESFGVPTQLAILAAIGALLAPIYIHSNDRYAIQRWRRKLRNWRN